MPNDNDEENMVDELEANNTSNMVTFASVETTPKRLPTPPPKDYDQDDNDSHDHVHHHHHHHLQYRKQCSDNNVLSEYCIPNTR